MGEKIWRLSEDDIQNEIGLNKNKLTWDWVSDEHQIKWYMETWRRVHPIIKKGEIAKIQLGDFGPNQSATIEGGVRLANTLNIFARVHDLEIESAIGGDRNDGYFLYIKKVLI